MSKRKASSARTGTSKKKREEEDDADFNLSQNPDFTVSAGEAEVGIIESLKLKNFMCHNALDIPFDPHVNFIVGRNGSGKSAVVTALVVGLGGKASTTNRGTSIKTFIKSGKSFAEVEIKLRNRGSDAYKPEIFGESIVIQRRFSSDGSSTYKFKSKTGQQVPVKKAGAELDRIKDQFNIQVDNPVAVLNQDTSRNFLFSKNSHDKYKFFLKATQLEQMKMDYRTASKNKESTMEIIQNKERKLPPLEQEVLEWEQKFKSLDALSELRIKVERLKKEMMWAIVFEREKGLEPIQKELKQEEVRMPKFEKKRNEAKVKVEAATKLLSDIQGKLAAMNVEVQDLQPRFHSAKKKRDEKKNQHRKLMMEVRKMEGNIKNLTRDRDIVVERIKEICSSAKDDYENEKIARQNKIQQLKDQVEALKAQIHTTEVQMNQFRNAVTKYKDDALKIKLEEQSCISSRDRLTKDLRTLIETRTNRLRKFGEWVPNVQKAISDAGRKGQFHQCPKGPLGPCFELTDKKWALAVETCLKGLVHAFCVNDVHDEKILEAIFKKYVRSRKPTIIISAFQKEPYDVSQHRVQASAYPCVLDVIDCNDPVITNTLIDQRSIENVILIEDNNEAREVMGKHPPKNCKEAFTLVGDQIYCYPSLRYYACGKDKAYFLSASVEEDMASLEIEKKNVEKQHHQLQQQQQQVQQDLKRNQTEERRCETQTMKLNERIRKMRQEIMELEMEQEDRAPVDVATLEEEVTNYNDQIRVLESNKKVVADQTAESHKELQEAEQAYSEVEEQMRARADSLEPLKDDLSHAQTEVELAKSHKKHYDTKFLEQEKKVNDLKKEIQNIEMDIESDISRIQEVCPERIHTRRTRANLDSEINQINKQIKVEEKNRGNPEEITRNYREKKQAFLDMKKDVRQFKTFLELLSKTMDQRIHNMKKVTYSAGFRVTVNFIQNIAINPMNLEGKLVISHKKQELNVYHFQRVMTLREQQFYEFRRIIAMRAKYFFIVLLGNRSYTGKMTFNHQKEILEMAVQPKKNDGQSGKDIKSLSGGERSFSTVCFILALWDAMESPFRCLDEFDIFMDMVNRRISMDMMMNVAQQQREKQFIFLTPQSMSHLSCEFTPKIFSMPDPDRTQSVLPFQAASRDEEEN